MILDTILYGAPRDIMERKKEKKLEEKLSMLLPSLANVFHFPKKFCIRSQNI